MDAPSAPASGSRLQAARNPAVTAAPTPSTFQAGNQLQLQQHAESEQPAHASRLLDLPDELLTAILASAVREHGCSSCCLCLVCKRFSALHSTLVPDLILLGHCDVKKIPDDQVPEQLQSLRSKAMQHAQLRSLTLVNMMAEEVQASLPARVLEHLRSLSLHGCHVDGVGSRLADCAELQDLTVAYWHGWEPWRRYHAHVIPEHLCELAIAWQRDLRATKADHITIALPKLRHLTRLVLVSEEHRPSMTIASEALPNVPNLRELVLDHVGYVDVSQLVALSKLEKLHLCTFHCDVDSLITLSKLTTLSSLTLQHHEDECDDWSCLSGFSVLTSLTELVLEWMDDPRCLEYCCALTALRSLRLQSGTAYNFNPHLHLLSQMTQMQTLFLSLDAGDDGVDLFGHLAPLTSLVDLTLTASCSAESLSLSVLQSLTRLTRLEFPTSTSLEPLRVLTNLRSLILLEAYMHDQSLAPVADLVQLQHFAAIKCATGGGWGPLTGLTHLSHLVFINGRNVNIGMCNFANVAALANMRRLSLVGAREVDDLTPVAAMTNLQDLDISDCRKITTLEPLAALRNLRVLRAYSCSRISSLQPLRGLTQLRWLCFGDAHRLSDISPLACFQRIHFLSVWGCSDEARAQARALRNVYILLDQR